ncbi:hypothetical protein [Streptomyces sp. WAC01280]|uniref:hypothetical protein n=1 Tax=Streptomyces sp. WAC01280 TaxID=2487424 RepID=UPI0011D1428E|nr:hypothetical protein [Streptomyces sp. WAC01280]
MIDEARRTRTVARQVAAILLDALAGHPLWPRLRQHTAPPTRTTQQSWNQLLAATAQRPWAPRPPCERPPRLVSYPESALSDLAQRRARAREGVVKRELHQHAPTHLENTRQVADSSPPRWVIGILSPVERFREVASPLSAASVGSFLL